MTLIVKTGFNGMTDADAIAYVNAVEAADGQLLEFGVGKAINDFVVGCKLDNTWSAIKASCILAGARTLTGALVPLVGTAPTNVGGLFVSGDYNRKTGLVGDGSTKYLNSNRAGDVDPLNNLHISVIVSTAATGAAGSTYLGGGNANGDLTDITRLNDTGQNALLMRNRRAIGASPGIIPNPAGSATGFLGCSRQSSNFFRQRYSGLNQDISLTTQSGASSFNYLLFALNASPPTNFSNARLAFYSIGESLDLALLDTRVTALITAFGVAIP
jgi:hypothetical protein